MGVERNDGATEYLFFEEYHASLACELEGWTTLGGLVFSQSGEGQKFLAKPSKQRGCARGWDDPQDGSQGHQQTRLGIKFAMFRILNGSSEIYIGGWAGTPRIQRVLAASSQAWRDSVRVLQDDGHQALWVGHRSRLESRTDRRRRDVVGQSGQPGVLWQWGMSSKKAMVVQCENTPANSKDAKSTVHSRNAGERRVEGP